MSPSFIHSESGAVTVDWVVMAASLVGLGLAATGLVSNGLQSQSNSVRAFLEGDLITASFGPDETVSDMSDGIDGWAFASNDASAGLQHDTGPGSDGQPGFMRFTDGGQGGAAYLGMSDDYLGDQAKLMGGTISFDMNMISGGRAIKDDKKYPILQIEGANGQTMTHTSAYEPERNGWNNFSADVTEGNWQIGGRDATKQEMEAILADVSQSKLRIEQAYGGNEVIGLDNVRYVNGS